MLNSAKDCKTNFDETSYAHAIVLNSAVNYFTTSNFNYRELWNGRIILGE